MGCSDAALPEIVRKINLNICISFVIRRYIPSLKEYK
jgi:hypothetical protein